MSSNVVKRSHSHAPLTSWPQRLRPSSLSSPSRPQCTGQGLSSKHTRVYRCTLQVIPRGGGTTSSELQGSLRGADRELGAGIVCLMKLGGVGEGMVGWWLGEEVGRAAWVGR